MQRDEWRRRLLNGLLLFVLLEIAGFCLLQLTRNAFTGGPHINPERAAGYHQILDTANWIWLAISVFSGLLWGRFCPLESRPKRHAKYTQRLTSPQVSPSHHKPARTDPCSDLPKCSICGRTREEAQYLTECDLCGKVVCSECVYHDAPDHHWTTCHNCGKRW